MKQEEIKIRKARKEDAKKISLMCRNTIKKINSKEYPKKIIDFLLNNYSTKKVLIKMKEREMFCAWKNKELIGVIDLKDNKRIGSFFVKVNYIGKGIGTELLEFIEDYAKKKGTKKVHLEPSHSAFNFYKKRGYKYIGKEKWPLEGIKEPLLKMEKSLR